MVHNTSWSCQNKGVGRAEMFGPETVNHPYGNAPPTMSNRICHVDWKIKKWQWSTHHRQNASECAKISESTIRSKKTKWPTDDFEDQETMVGESWHRFLDGQFINFQTRTENLWVWVGQRWGRKTYKPSGANVGDMGRDMREKRCSHQRGPGEHARNRSAKVKAHAHDQNVLELPWRMFQDWLTDNDG